MVVAPSASISLARPIAVILPFSVTMVSASRIGFSMAPESSRPILRITSLVGPAAWGSSWAMDLFPCCLLFRPHRMRLLRLDQVGFEGNHREPGRFVTMKAFAGNQGR